MTDFKALTDSPADFDNELARLSGDCDRLNAAINRIEREEAHREAGDTRHRDGTSAWWELSLAEALARAPKANAERERLFSDLAVVCAGLKEADAAYTGWPRFFPTETSGGGHVHASMSCHTLYVSTDIRWRPDLSGKTVDEAVAELGPLLCQVCFPEARAEYKRDPREYARERNAERKAAEKAEKAAKDAPKKLTGDEQFTTSYGGDRVTTVAACKQLIRDAVEQRVELEWYRTPAAITDWAGTGEQLANVARNVAAHLAQKDDDAARAEAVLLRRESQHQGHGATAVEISQIKDRADKKARKAWAFDSTEL
jgi:hypothetical protein